MEAPQTEKTASDEQLGDHTDDPFVPPKGDACFINRIPPELLSCIIGLRLEADMRDPEPDYDDALDGCWRKLCISIEESRFVPVQSDDEDDETSEDENEDEIDHKGGKWEEEEAEDEGGDTDDQGDENIGEDEMEDEDNEDEDEDGWETDDGSGSSETTSQSSGPLDPSTWLPFPFVASHVCRHWRTVVLSTPSLWSSIYLNPDVGRSYELDWAHLERSGSVPVDVSVNCKLYTYFYKGGKPSDVEVRDVFSRLIPHAHRWRKMEVTAVDYSFMYEFLKAVADPAIPAPSQLTTLILRHEKERKESDNFAYPTMSQHFILFSGSAPLLTNVVLWGVHVDWDQPWISSASNLKDLELAYHPEDVRPSWTQFATILRGAPALEKLTLRQSGPSGDPAEWFTDLASGNPSDASLNKAIDLSRVTHFVFAFHSQGRAIGLFRRLYLPALKHLVLALNEGNFTEFVHILAGPATSLSPTQERPRSLLNRLESLKIAGMPCRAGCAKTLYSELQNLRSLNISERSLPSFVRTLYRPCTLPGRSNVWLPRLETLYISPRNGRALCKMVKKRKSAGVPLGLLRLHDRYITVSPADKHWLEMNTKVDHIRLVAPEQSQSRIYAARGRAEESKCISQ